MPTLRHAALFAVLLMLFAWSAGAQNLGVSGTTYTHNGGYGNYTIVEVANSGTLILNSGTIQAITAAYLGHNSPGTALINGGVLRANHVYVGQPEPAREYGGIVIQTGGTVRGFTSVRFGDTDSTYELRGGLIDAPRFIFDATGPRSNHLVLTSGTLATYYIAEPLENRGDNKITFNGGTVSFTVGENNCRINVEAAIDGGGAFFQTNGNRVVFEQALTHTGTAARDGGVTITGGGYVEFQAASNTYTGRTVHSSGTLSLSGSIQHSTLDTAGVVTFYHTGAFGTVGTITLGGLAGAGQVQLSGRRTVDLVVGGNHENTTFTGLLSGEGALVKNGTGALTLSGTNYHTGGTVVNSGTLILKDNASAPRHDSIGILTGTLTVNNAVVRAESANTFGYATGLKVNAMVLNSGTFLNAAAQDQGWGVAYMLNGDNLLSSNGGVSSGTTLSKFAFGGPVGGNTSLTVNSGSSTIAGRVDLRTDNGVVGVLNENVDFTVNSGATLLVSAAVTNSRASAGFTKLGGGDMILSGSNTYSGTTRISSGTLVARNNHAMGTGSVVIDGGIFIVEEGHTIGNAVELRGGSYSRTVTGSLAGRIDDTSDIAGGRDTTAAILAGNNTATRYLTTGFSATSGAPDDGLRRSDVYHLDGTGAEIFVLELSFTSTEPDAFLGWLNGSNKWMNATLGNSLNTATGAMLNYDGTWAEFLAEFQPTFGANLSAYLGAYGSFTDGGTTGVWAVLDHNSDFTVIPEPGTVALLALGAIAFMRRRLPRT